MIPEPRVIRLDDIPGIIAEKFKDRDSITCYVGSNAATPTASLESLTAGIEAGEPRLPFMRMVHLLLQGTVPVREEGSPGPRDGVLDLLGGESEKSGERGARLLSPLHARQPRELARRRPPVQAGPRDHEGEPSGAHRGVQSRTHRRRSPHRHRSRQLSSSRNWTRACRSRRGRASWIRNSSTTSSWTSG